MELKLRYSKEDIKLCKKVFKEDDALLLAIRNVFYQLPVEERFFKEVKPLLGLLKKTFLPDFDSTTSLFQQADIFFAFKEDIKSVNPGIASLRIKAIDLINEYLKQQFAVLSGESKDERIKLLSLRNDNGGTEEGRYVNLNAYLFLTNSFIESSLERLNILANQKEETLEERKKRLEANSSK